jgi:prepilin-type processing-associated H-X9-DG protein
VVSQAIKMFVCPSTESGRVDTLFKDGVPKPAAGDYGSINGVKQDFWSAIPTLGVTKYHGDEDHLPNVGVLAKQVISKPATFPCKIKDITDGTSKTIMVVEDAGRPVVWAFGRISMNPKTGQQNIVSNGTGWADPDNGGSLSGSKTDLDSNGVPKQPGPIVINACNNSEVYSFHPNGAQACFADGSAHFLADTMDPLVFMALVTRGGNENVPAGAY